MSAPVTFLTSALHKKARRRLLAGLFLGFACMLPVIAGYLWSLGSMPWLAYVLAVVLAVGGYFVNQWLIAPWISLLRLFRQAAQGLLRECSLCQVQAGAPCLQDGLACLTLSGTDKETQEVKTFYYPLALGKRVIPAECSVLVFSGMLVGFSQSAQTKQEEA